MMKKGLLFLLLLAMLAGLASVTAAEEDYRTLTLGDRGSDVLALKQRMYYLGYFKSLDNLSDQYNKVMAERIRLLQRNNHLEEDGIATPELQALIFSDACVWIAPTPRPTPVPTPAPTPVAPQVAVTLPPTDTHGFLADGSAPFVYQNPEDGRWIYLSGDIHVDIQRFNDTTLPLVWFETRIRLAQGSRLRSLLALKDGKTPGHSFKMPQSILDDYPNVIVAFSDDFYGYRWSHKRTQGIIIRDGEIMSGKTSKAGNLSWPQLDIFAVFQDGTAKTFVSDAYTAEEYLAMGVQDTYAFGPILVQEGKISDDVYAYPYAQTRVAPRTAIGWIGPNEYLALTVQGRRKDSRGATVEWLARRMVACGVQEALNLDGGNTCSLFFMGKLLNRSELVQDKDIRKVTGLIGVTEGE